MTYIYFIGPFGSKVRKSAPRSTKIIAFGSHKAYIFHLIHNLPLSLQFQGVALPQRALPSRNLLPRNRQHGR